MGLGRSLLRTRQRLSEALRRLVPSRRIDPADIEALEEALITADVGPATAARLIDGLASSDDPGDRLRGAMLEVFAPRGEASAEQGTAEPGPGRGAPWVVLLVGVNGSGKTTSAAKLAARYQDNGCSIIMGAADTFRAAAVEQLRIWGERLGIPVIAQAPGSDPAAVVYDACEAGRARGIDVVLVDTAGRLHTKANLMAELAKMRRAAAKAIAGAPHEVWLVLDATTGQNGLRQAEDFLEHAGVSGLILAKLDGSAKGGVALAIADRLALPIRYVGTGEASGDLEPFDPEAFVNGLLGEEN